MRTEKYELTPPSLQDLAEALRKPLAANYEHSTVEVAPCPDLRTAPFHLATEGLSGNEKIADVGGQPNLFPRPVLSSKFSLTEIAEAMEMNPERGSLIGAGAGPFHVLGTNCELVPHLSWEHGLHNVDNQSRYISVDRETGVPSVKRSPSLDSALMVNLYGSHGLPGPILKITAGERIGAEKSFTECIRKALHSAYGDSRIISLGGAVLIKSGTTHFHVMPDFPTEEQLPFQNSSQVNDWLTYHDFDEPIVCVSVLHSADPGKKLGLRMEHTHGFSAKGGNAGGHYHYDTVGDAEYEAYFNTAKTLYRVEQPPVVLERDLHD